MKRFLFPCMFASVSLSAYAAQTPTCADVHVWYSLANDSQANWSVQIARLYENNISFLDENCTELDLNQKIVISPAQTRYVGMKVDVEKGFTATYSFMGVNTGTSSNGNLQIPKGVATCAFLVAPYAPGQMDRVDWRMNNADCYSNNLGTEMHFK